MGTFKRKHQGQVQEYTPTAISEYIMQAGETFRNMQNERDFMKQVDIDKRAQAELIGRLLIEEQLISTMQVNQIASELKKPTYDYGAPDSLWELYQFTTQTMRETHPRNWIKDHMDAHRFFVNESGALSYMEDSVSPAAVIETIMHMTGDSQEEIEQFRQIEIF